MVAISAKNLYHHNILLRACQIWRLEIYGKAILAGKPTRLRLIADTATPVGMTIEAEVLAAANRLDSAVRIALILEQVTSDRAPFDYAFEQALSAWD